MPGQWMGRPGADVEFLVNDPKEAATLEAAFKKNPDDKSLVGRYRFKGEAVGAESQPDFVGRIKRWFTTPPEPGSIQAGIESVPGLGMLGAGQRMAAQAILPGTNAGGMIDATAALVPGGKIAKELIPAAGVLPALGRSAVRAAIPTVAGMIGGSAPGGEQGSMLEGAKTGAIAGATGEALGALPAGVAAFYKKYGHLNTESFKRAVGNRIGPKFADMIAEDIPSLGRATTMASVRDVSQMTTPEGGQRVMGKMFDKTEGKIVQALSGQRVAMPFEALQATGRAGNTPSIAQAMASGRATGRVPMGAPSGAAQALGAVTGAPVWVDVPPAEAIRIAKEVREKAFKGVQTASGQSMRELADASMQSLLTKVQGADAQLAGEYTQLRDDYGKFKDFVDFIRKEGNTDLMPTIKGGYTIDMPKFYDAMRNGEIDPARFPNLWGLFEGGTGSGPVQRGAIIPRIVAGGRTGRIAETLPIPKRVQLTPGLEKIVESSSKLGKIAQGTRTTGTIVFTPTIEQMLLDSRENANEPLPSTLLGGGQPTEQPTP